MIKKQDGLQHELKDKNTWSNISVLTFWALFISQYGYRLIKKYNHLTCVCGGKSFETITID